MSRLKSAWQRMNRRVVELCMLIGLMIVIGSGPEIYEFGIPEVAEISDLGDFRYFRESEGPEIERDLRDSIRRFERLKRKQKRVQLREWDRVPLKEGLEAELICESLNLRQDIYWSFSQEIVDDPESMVHFPYSGLFGEPGRIAMVFDHNYQSGRDIAMLPEGSLIKIKTEGITWVYAWDSAEHGEMVDTMESLNPIVVQRWESGISPIMGNHVVTDEGISISQISCEKQDTDESWLYLITCYPLDKYETGERLIVKFKLVAVDYAKTQ